MQNISGLNYYEFVNDFDEKVEPLIIVNMNDIMDDTNGIHKMNLEANSIMRSLRELRNNHQNITELRQELRINDTLIPSQMNKINETVYNKAVIIINNAFKTIEELGYEFDYTDLNMTRMAIHDILHTCINRNKPKDTHEPVQRVPQRRNNESRNEPYKGLFSKNTIEICKAFTDVYPKYTMSTPESTHYEPLRIIRDRIIEERGGKCPLKDVREIRTELARRYMSSDEFCAWGCSEEELITSANIVLEEYLNRSYPETIKDIVSDISDELINECTEWVFNKYTINDLLHDGEPNPLEVCKRISDYYCYVRPSKELENKIVKYMRTRIFDEDIIKNRLCCDKLPFTDLHMDESIYKPFITHRIALRKSIQSVPETDSSDYVISMLNLIIDDIESVYGVPSNQNEIINVIYEELSPTVKPLKIHPLMIVAVGLVICFVVKCFL